MDARLPRSRPPDSANSLQTHMTSCQENKLQGSTAARQCEPRGRDRPAAPCCRGGKAFCGARGLGPSIQIAGLLRQTMSPKPVALSAMNPEPSIPSFAQSSPGPVPTSTDLCANPTHALADMCARVCVCVSQFIEVQSLCIYEKIRMKDKAA